jgi:hypothetical protein
LARAPGKRPERAPGTPFAASAEGAVEQRDEAPPAREQRAPSGGVREPPALGSYVGQLGNRAASREISRVLASRRAAAPAGVPVLSRFGTM